jgi:hypothetical protein
MFLELEQGFGGLVRISPEPMRQAVKTLEARTEQPKCTLAPFGRWCIDRARGEMVRAPCVNVRADRPWPVAPAGLRV